MNDTAIKAFKGKHRFLSNFYPATVSLDGLEYPSVEHAFQAAKTLDPEARDAIRAAGTPGKAKRMGRKVDLREDWEESKLLAMLELVWQKFFKHPELKQLLLDTGDVEIIEGNSWGDSYWGVCEGKGRNNMGRLLMYIRERCAAYTDEDVGSRSLP